MLTAPAGTRTSRHERSTQCGPPASAPPPSARPDLPPPALPGSVPHRRAASGSPPLSPAAGSSSPTTSDSRSGTDCSPDPCRSPRGTARPPRLPPYWPPRACTPPTPAASVSRTTSPLNLTCPLVSSRERPGCSCEQIQMIRPLRSPAITAGSALLRAGPPTSCASVLNASRFPPLGALPLAPPTSAEQ